MPGSKKAPTVEGGISSALEYKDVRSDAVPSLRAKTHRKRYRNANVDLIGKVRNDQDFRNLNEHQMYWNEKNIFQMKPNFTIRAGIPKPSKKSIATGVRTEWVSEEISRVLYETDEELYDEDPNADSDLDMVDGSNPVIGGFENRGELVWDVAFKIAEEKWVDGVLKKEWEVVDDGREDEDKEFEEDEGFQLL